MIQPYFPHHHVNGDRPIECRGSSSLYWEMEPEEFQTIRDKYGDMLYAVYPRIAPDQALYRP
eukprot:3840831-Prorocentrum_lima.AAC.1